MAVMTQLVKPQMVYIQKETSNQSFLDMHYYLKSKGIQNNDFFLALLDPSLAGVDPRDPNLSSVTKAKILNEVRLNYWYFLREVVRIPTQGNTSGGVRYKLHRGNLAMNFLYTLNFNQILIESRQHGKTVGALCRYLWVYNFGTTNSEIVFMHKDHAGSKRNLKDLKTYRDALPSYLQMSSAVNNEGKHLKVPNTVVMVQHPYNNNKITTYPSARNKDAANNLGRGSTVPIIYYDEFAFMPFNKEVYLAATPAYSTASRNAQSNGAPYGMCITTTPGDLLTDSGRFAYDMLNNATPWSEDFYDYTYEQLCNIRDANTHSAFFKIVYTYQQLGSGQDYFKRMVVELNREWPAIRREVMLEWAETATNCPFAQDDLDIIKNYLKDPIRSLRFGKFNQYEFLIYEDIDLSYPPIIGVDVSGAMYQDSSAITVIDSHTTRVCATLNCNYMPSDDLAEVLYELVTKYMNNAIICIERNGGFGTSVIQRLCKTSIKKNLYWEVKDKVIEESFNGVRMEKRPRKIKVYGMDSTKDLRARLIEILYERVAYHKDKFVAPILHQEMQCMETKKSGKVEHSDNSHDDQVFSYLWALYVWYDGKNLAQNWNVYKNTLKTDAEEELEEDLIEDQLESKEKVDIEKFTYDDNRQEILDDLEWIEKNNNIITTEDMKTEQYIRRIEQRNIMAANSNNVRQTLIDITGVDSVNYQNKGNDYVDLPNSIYTNDDIDIFDDEDDIINNHSNYRNRKTNLAGNLSQFYDDL